MKGLFIFVLAFSLSAFGAYVKKPEVQTASALAESGSPIPDAYSASNPKSLIYSSASNCKTLRVQGTMATRCYLKMSNSASAPSNSIAGSHPFGPGSVIDYADNILIKKYWFLKCDGNPETGDVIVQCF